jgi:hypothetical protein
MQPQTWTLLRADILLKTLFWIILSVCSVVYTIIIIIIIIIFTTTTEPLRIQRQAESALLIVTVSDVT